MLAWRGPLIRQDWRSYEQGKFGGAVKEEEHLMKMKVGTAALLLQAKGHQELGDRHRTDSKSPQKEATLPTP